MMNEKCLSAVNESILQALFRINLFEEPTLSVLNQISKNTIISATLSCSKLLECGDTANAFEEFRTQTKMPLIQLINAWINFRIYSLPNEKNPVEPAIKVIEQHNIKPNSYTLSSALKFCSTNQRLQEAINYFRLAKKFHYHFNSDILNIYLTILNNFNHHFETISLLTDYNIAGGDTSDSLLCAQIVALLHTGNFEESLLCLSLIQSDVPQNVYNKLSVSFGEMSKTKLDFLSSIFKKQNLDIRKTLRGFCQGYYVLACEESMLAVLDHLYSFGVKAPDLESNYIKLLLSKEKFSQVLERLDYLFHIAGELQPFIYISKCLHFCIKTGNVEFTHEVLKSLRLYGFGIPPEFWDPTWIQVLKKRCMNNPNMPAGACGVMDTVRAIMESPSPYNAKFSINSYNY